MTSVEPTTEPEPVLAPLRVLHVYSGNLYGGVEAFLRTLARYRRDPSVTTDFALCFDRQIARDLRGEGATVHILGEVRVRAPRSVMTARRALARALERGRYQVVLCHSPWPHALFAPVVRAYGARLAYYMHEVPNPRGWIDRWAARSRPDLVLCNSAFTEESSRWLFDGVPRRVLHPAMMLHDGAAPRTRESVRASLGTAPDALVVLQACRMEGWKGHRLLLDALARLRDDPRWVCWIAGQAQRPREVAYERELRDSVVRLGIAERVQFLGHRDDVPSLMRAADIHCQPNLGPEPFGLAFVEALSAGLPVVTTRMGAPLEIVNESCGRLVPPEAPALAEGLRSLFEDRSLRLSLSGGGPARARELCDPEARVRDLAGMLRGMVSSAPMLDAPSRASLSEGKSDDAILSVVAAALREVGPRHETIVDFGCGRGDCARYLEGMYGLYTGCDVVRYVGFPQSDAIRFREVDLNIAPYPLEDASANVVVSVETIEHLENPRALVREMARVVRPGGWVVLTTPNQLSLASKLSLVAKNQFQAFQEAPGLYPAHITALVEEDLRRIARECGLGSVEIRYTDHGRIPFTRLHWPRALGARGRWFSENVVLLARRP